MDLYERGVITNARKTLYPGKMATSFIMGSQALYDFADNNPVLTFHPSNHTNDPFQIAQNHKMVAINSAIQVDLTGQVCADTMGMFQYSGIGGQVDFIRGAARSEGGKPVIALPSTARDDKISRIVPVLEPGAAATTSRGDVHWVATEYGAAYLHGKTLRQRAQALVGIAHPAFREWLTGEARKRKVL
jgi:acyl-CoA hydrolase